MNIFALSLNPQWAAEYLCNKHLAKMLLESCQLLANHHSLPKYTDTTNLALGPSYQYKPTHQHHPCSLWLAQSPTIAYLGPLSTPFTANQLWLLLHAHAIYSTYMSRYGNPKAAKRKHWPNQSLPQAFHKCAIPLQKLTYAVLEATGCANIESLFSLLWHQNKPRFTSFPQAMPDQYKIATTSHHSSIQAYRQYYIADKQRFATWSGRTTPHWWPKPYQQTA